MTPDALKGRVCGNCHYRTGRHCRLRYSPAGLDDGCEDFTGRPVDAFKGWPAPRQRAAPKGTQRPSYESGGMV